MDHRQITSIMKLLVLHVQDTTKHGGSPPTDAASLLVSKLTNDPSEGWLVHPMNNLLTDVVRATRHPNIVNFLVDAFIAVSRLLDLSWNGETVNARAFHILRSIRFEVVVLMKAMVDREAAIKKGTIMNVVGNFPAAIRTGFTTMDPYEVLGLQNYVHDSAINMWRMRFMRKARGIFQAEGLRHWLIQQQPCYA